MSYQEMKEYKQLRIGETPVVKLENLDLDSTNHNIFAKLELYNPTGSHKDRESLELVTYCIKNGLKDIGCASTGNFGISLSYLSNIFKIRCHVWVSNRISSFRESYLKSFGAIIYKVEGGLCDIYKYSSEIMKDKGIYDANPGGNQIKINANKKIFEEVINDLPDINLITTCINNGTHYLGLFEAAREYNIPINAIFTFDKRAKSISGFTGYEGMEKIKINIDKNNGSLIEANSDDINLGLKITKENGLIVEASSAAVIGVALRSSKENRNVCCIITGNGLKYPEEIMINN